MCVCVCRYVFIKFKATPGSLSMTPSGPVSLSVIYSTNKPCLISLLQGYSDLPALYQVTVLGISSSPIKVTLNGATVGFFFSDHKLVLKGLGAVLSNTNTIQWM